MATHGDRVQKEIQILFFGDIRVCERRRPGPPEHVARTGAPAYGDRPPRISVERHLGAINFAPQRFRAKSHRGGVAREATWNKGRERFRLRIQNLCDWVNIKEEIVDLRASKEDSAAGLDKIA